MRKLKSTTHLKQLFQEVPVTTQVRCSPSLPSSPQLRIATFELALAAATQSLPEAICIFLDGVEAEFRDVCLGDSNGSTAVPT
ncbi:hypothetical protein OCU04_011438 [Sclerotinia nivalis]|uniref:Uncharacterized protein n=1 Tax=Sclerotinia nivalis TaxID=352851 RepID=A0A9X0DFI5_9HELO|nr:hypothetical protein OCU04_011438 [Sclerotinia nivalis]